MMFNKNLVFLLLCLILLLSCSKNPASDSIIDEGTFVDLLVDIHMADATLVVTGYRIITDSTAIRLFYNDVLLKHNVTQKQIQNTFQYYTKKPKKFEKVYEEVSEKIVKLEENCDETKAKNKLENKTDTKQKREIEEYE